MTGFRVADGGGPVIPNFGQGSSCIRHNGWFCTEWVREHWGDILQPALIQHIELALIAVGIGFAISFLLALVGFRWRLLDAPLGAFTDVLYTIPSIALFQLLVPITGLTVTTIEVALVSYTFFVLYRNIVAGLRGGPAAWGSRGCRRASGSSCRLRCRPSWRVFGSRWWRRSRSRRLPPSSSTTASAARSSTRSGSRTSSGPSSSRPEGSPSSSP